MADHIRIDPIDPVELKLTLALSPAQRVQRLIDARTVLVALVRGRLSAEHPDLSMRELNLKVIERLDQRHV